MITGIFVFVALCVAAYFYFTARCPYCEKRSVFPKTPSGTRESSRRTILRWVRDAVANTAQLTYHYYVDELYTCRCCGADVARPTNGIGPPHFEGSKIDVAGCEMCRETGKHTGSFRGCAQCDGRGWILIAANVQVDK